MREENQSESRKIDRHLNYNNPASLFPNNYQQTVQDDVVKLWNLARNVKDDIKLVCTVNKRKGEWKQKVKLSSLPFPISKVSLKGVSDIEKAI